MSKSRIALVAALAALALGGAGWYLIPRAGRSAPVAAADTTSDSASSRQEKEVKDVPWELVRWIDATLWRNGILDMRDSFLAEDPAARTRLDHDTLYGKTIWHVDFSGLPVSTLGKRRGGDEDWTEFDVSVRLHHARFCHEGEPGEAGISAWMDSKVSGLDEQSCAPADDAAQALRWFRTSFARAPRSGEFSGPAGRAPTAIRVRCAEGDSLRSIGLLRQLGIDTLEFDGCRFDEGTQMLLAQMDLKQLVLRNVAAPALDFTAGRIPGEMRVEGGAVNVVLMPVECPDGKSYCEDSERVVDGGRLVLRDVPVCDTSVVGYLGRLGAVLESPRCTDYPQELVEARDRMRAGWREIYADAEAVTAKRYDSLKPEDLAMEPKDPLQTWAYSTTDWDYCEEDGPFPDGFSTDAWRAGKDWIDDDRTGLFLRGDAIAFAYRGKPLRAGLTKAQVVAILGRPSVNRGAYLAWGVHNEDCISDPDGLVLRFDEQGRLESLLKNIDFECGGC